MTKETSDGVRLPTGLEYAGHLALFWGIILLLPLTAILYGAARLIIEGFAFRRLIYIVAGVIMLVLDYMGTTGASNWWFIAFIPHALLPTAVALFTLELLRMRLVYACGQWYYRCRQKWRLARSR